MKTQAALVLVLLLQWGILSSSQTYLLPNGGNIPGTVQLRQASDGSVYIAVGDMLIKLDQELNPVANVTLSSPAVRMTLASQEENSVVCMEDLSCAVYRTTDLLSMPRSTNAMVTSNRNLALFPSSGSDFIVGSSSGPENFTLSRVDSSGQVIYSPVAKVYYVSNSEFQNRTFLYGFSRGKCSYFIVYDSINIRGIFYYEIRVVKSCHNDSCCSGTSTCSFTSISEELLSYGSFGPKDVCKVSVVQNYGASSNSGESFLLTICGNPLIGSRNMISSFSLSMIDDNMNRVMELCAGGNSRCVATAWSMEQSCSELSSTTCFSAPIGDYLPCYPFDIPLIGRKDVMNFPSSNEQLTSSIPVQLDGQSLLLVSYVTSNLTSFVGIFEVGNGLLTLQDAFLRREFSSPVTDLVWEDGLDYVLAASNRAIFKIALDECAQHKDCSSCMSEPNPLCGWCANESKCSRLSQCTDGSPLGNGNWIHSNPSMPLCVTSEILTLSEGALVNISVHPLRLAAYSNETSYQCVLVHLNEGQPLVIPAMQNSISGSYSCLLNTSSVPSFIGTKSEYGLKFQNSDSVVLVEITSIVLTLLNCSSANTCKDCISSERCGWCFNSGRCMSSGRDCTGPPDFIQVSSGQTFHDVCPLLLRQLGNSSYQHHVRIAEDLHLRAVNLPPAENSYVYKCRIGDTETSARWTSTTSISCLVEQNQINILNSSVLTTVDVFWTGPDTNNEIETLQPIEVSLYDCNKMASDCSSCLESLTEYNCGWCPNEVSKCSISNECTLQSSSSLITVGQQCPPPSILGFTPTSGPPDGGTVITILGTDLGVSIEDFRSIYSIRIGKSPCVPLSSGYIAGKRVLCRTINTTEIGRKQLVVNLTRLSGPFVVTAPQLFDIVQPNVVSLNPSFGPIAGGSALVIRGLHFDIGNNATVTLYGYDGPRCPVVFRNSSVIRCITSVVPKSRNYTGFVVVHVDEQLVADPSVMFQYRDNPVLLSVHPKSAIQSGGINVTFTGTNLDTVQQPKLQLNSSLHPCAVLNSSAVTCAIPTLDGVRINQYLDYSLELSSVLSTSSLENPTLHVRVISNPVNLKLITPAVTYGVISGANFVLIQGENLRGMLVSEVVVRIGGQDCTNIRVTSEILCMPPLNPTLNEDKEAEVIVYIGRNLQFPLEKKLSFVYPITAAPVSSFNTNYLLLFVFVPIFLLCCIAYLIIWFCLRRFKSRRKVTYNVTNKEFSFMQEESKPNTYDDALGISETRRIKTKSSADLLEEMTGQLSQTLIISEEQLEILDVPLGQGQFGMVYKGKLSSLSDGVPSTAPVAVKAFKGLMSSDIQMIFAEIFKMQDLSHPNVMNLVGVCISVTRGPSIVMPFMENGSLLHYLKKERTNLYLKYDSPECMILSVKKLLLRMCHQIALGMDYLSDNQIVHRDLAARNCLLDCEGNIKVSDFGLSEDIYVSGYFRQNKNDPVKLPFKWMAPESLRDGMFSHKSDVWSFGITCWEVFSAGRTPYPGVDAIDLFRYIEEGVRLENPFNAASDEDIYSLMLMCWEPNPEGRPSFQDIPTLIDNRMDPISDYMEMDMILQPCRFEDYEDMRSVLNHRTVNNEYINQKEMEAKREEALEFNQIKLETARGGYGEESV